MVVQAVLSIHGFPITGELAKFVVSTVVQLFLGISAAVLTWRLARSSSEREHASLKIELYERRLEIFLAFREFIEHCAVNEKPSDVQFARFRERTERMDFLFGPEVRIYRKKTLANALAMRAMVTGEQFYGVYPGSTDLTTMPEFMNWFIKQHRSEMELYFIPYLDFSRAGVDLSAIKMRPTPIPENKYIYRRKIESRDSAPSDNQQTKPSALPNG